MSKEAKRAGTRAKLGASWTNLSSFQLGSFSDSEDDVAPAPRRGMQRITSDSKLQLSRTFEDAELSSKPGTSTGQSVGLGRRGRVKSVSRLNTGNYFTGVDPDTEARKGRRRASSRSRLVSEDEDSKGDSKRSAVRHRSRSASRLIAGDDTQQLKRVNRRTRSANRLISDDNPGDSTDTDAQNPGGRRRARRTRSMTRLLTEDKEESTDTEAKKPAGRRRTFSRKGDDDEVHSEYEGCQTDDETKNSREARMRRLLIDENLEVEAEDTPPAKKAGEPSRRRERSVTRFLEDESPRKVGEESLETQSTHERRSPGEPSRRRERSVTRLMDNEAPTKAEATKPSLEERQLRRRARSMTRLSVDNSPETRKKSQPVERVRRGRSLARGLNDEDSIDSDSRKVPERKLHQGRSKSERLNVGDLLPVRKLRGRSRSMTRLDAEETSVEKAADKRKVLTKGSSLAKFNIWNDPTKEEAHEKRVKETLKEPEKDSNERESQAEEEKGAAQPRARPAMAKERSAAGAELAAAFESGLARMRREQKNKENKEKVEKRKVLEGVKEDKRDGMESEKVPSVRKLEKKSSYKEMKKEAPGKPTIESKDSTRMFRLLDVYDNVATAKALRSNETKDGSQGRRYFQQHKRFNAVDQNVNLMKPTSHDTILKQDRPWGGAARMITTRDLDFASVSKRFNKARTFEKMLALLLLSVSFGLVALYAMKVTNSSRIGNGVLRVEEPVPTASPHSNPTAHLVHLNPPDPNSVIRIEELKYRIIATGISSNADLSDLRSIAFYALRWLSDTDSAEVAVDDKNMLQRYAMAVLFYSRYPHIADPHSNGEWWKFSSLGLNFQQWMNPTHICDWHGIECHSGSPTAITLPRNGIQGTIPSEINAFTDLVTLHLSSNQITGTVPSLDGLSNLENLRLDQNQLTGTLPNLNKHSHLEQVDLHANGFTGRVPEKLEHLSKLMELNLGHNNLHGTISEEINYLVRLTSLNLQNNNLNGHLPSLMSLTNLHFLQLGRNSFSGKLPGEWANLPLKYLVLNTNRISGTIPEEFGDLSNLEVLWMNENNLHGTIPSELGRLKKLKNLFLENNKLVGSIPTELGALEEIVTIRLHANDINGEVPTEVCDNHGLNLQFLSADCIADVSCDCCNCCDDCQ